jgi:hypothetical protein
LYVHPEEHENGGGTIMVPFPTFVVLLGLVTVKVIGFVLFTGTFWKLSDPVIERIYPSPFTYRVALPPPVKFTIPILVPIAPVGRKRSVA